MAPASPSVRMVASATRPRVQYRTTATSCTCPGYHFRALRDPLYRCRHMREAFPTYEPFARCCCCGEPYAWGETLPLFCRGCVKGWR